MIVLRERLRDRLSLLREWREAMLVEDPAAPGWDATPPRRIDLPHIARAGLNLGVHVSGCGWVDARRLLPCLDDPATVGILAELVRQRAPDADLHTGAITAHRRAGMDPGPAAALAYLAVTESEVTL